MKYSTEDLFKLIGELSGYGPTSTTVHVTFNPARRFNVYGESEGVDLDDWGYAVSTKICSTEDIRAEAQDKDLNEALWKLAQAVVSKFETISTRWKNSATETRQKFNKFLEQNKT